MSSTPTEGLQRPRPKALTPISIQRDDWELKKKMKFYRFAIFLHRGIKTFSY